MKHLDPILLTAQADTLEREAEATLDRFTRAKLLIRANILRSAAREVRRLSEDCTS